MNNLIFKIAALLCSLYLSACSTSNTVSAFTPLSAEADQVVVYIYRPSVMSNAIYSPDLHINGEFKLSIKSGKNTRLLLSPGKNKFELEPDKNYSGLTRLSLNLKTGATYFIRVNTSLKIKSATNYGAYERGFSLTEISEHRAVKEIAECCIARNKKATNETEAKSTKKEPDIGFSVDKTQNPFSH